MGNRAEMCRQRETNANVLPPEWPIPKSKLTIAKCPASGGRWPSDSWQSIKRWLE
jgi:hypothetical protein